MRNYATDAETKRIVDNTDLFLIPSNNPDGANIQLLQLRLAAAQHDQPLPGRQRGSGTAQRLGRRPQPQLLRRRRGFDGYDGASTSCISDTFQGPAELSEPESQNIIDLVERNRNIKFMMSVHSNGGQLFWQPGAYIANGRITTPRPPLGHEAFYWQSASRILSQVRAERQTVVTPGERRRVDATSSTRAPATCARSCTSTTASTRSAGRSAARSTTRRPVSFQEGSFQPPWVGDPNVVSGHSETMEYANGVMEMFRIAADWGMDKTPATSTLRRRGPVGLAARACASSTNEPATIYYTTDGSTPTVELAALQGDRVPRTGRDPVGGGTRRRSGGSRSTPRATSSRSARRRCRSARRARRAARCRRRCR